MGADLPQTHGRQSFRFRVDRPLGKLAKWLRLLGYDTVSDRLSKAGHIRPGSRHDDRIWIIAADLPVRTEGIIGVNATDPIRQVFQVLTALGIERESLKPFTRCIQCNHELDAVARKHVRGRVPDYIWETHKQFRTCSKCNRIFWRGSHVVKQRRIMDRLFKGDRIE